MQDSKTSKETRNNQTVGLPKLRVLAALRTKRAEVWGWRRKQAGHRWFPQGVCIGWVVRDDLFLESTAAYQAAQHGTERLPVSEQTLRHRMREHGLLASIDAGRQMLLVRRTLGGCARQVLHLRASDLVGPIAESGRKPVS